MTDPARVTVIMVTYNSAHIIGEALRHLPGPDVAKLIVVDNASVDDSLGVVRRLRSDALCIENETNVGFAQAVNIGAHSAESEFILLLNPDAYLSGSDIRTLVDDMDRDSGIGVIAPLMTDPHGKYSTIAAGYSPTIRRMALHASGVSRLSRLLPILEGHYLFRGSRLNTIRDVDWVSGGCLMIRRSIWTDLHGLSSRWFMYAEDVELCLRVRAAGWKVALDPAASAIHDFGGSSKEVVGKANPAWIVNLYDLYSTDIATNDLQRWLWRHTVAAGFRARSATYGLLAVLKPASAEEYRAHRERFGIFTTALLHAG